MKTDLEVRECRNTVETVESEALQRKLKLQMAPQLYK